MEIRAFEEIVLLKDLPNGHFSKGTLGVVADVLNEGKGFVIEFFAANGQTLGVEIMDASFVASASEFPYPIRVENAA
ncbi:MAG TPA: DUF4926 domain-containing protein [Catalimonadaceae bacterium]|nr:DUF4926 domain-containing protein [Catalimonadaceae bacterium]